MIILYTEIFHCQFGCATAAAHPSVPSVPPELLTLPTDHAVASELAERIHRLWKQGTDLGQVAVLYRRRRLSQQVAQRLKERGVPHVVVSGCD